MHKTALTLTIKVPEGMTEQEVFGILQTGLSDQIGEQERPGLPFTNEKRVLEALAEADPDLKSPPDELQTQETPEPEDRLFEVLWHGTVEGEAFDGDPSDLW